MKNGRDEHACRCINDARCALVSTDLEALIVILKVVENVYLLTLAVMWTSHGVHAGQGMYILPVSTRIELPRVSPTCEPALSASSGLPKKKWRTFKPRSCMYGTTCGGLDRRTLTLGIYSKYRHQVKGYG